MKNILIIDVQSHYTQQDTKDYVRKLLTYLKENKSDIKSISVVIDLIHEDNGIDFDFIELENFTDFQENEDMYLDYIFYFEENNPNLIPEFDKYIKQYRLPIRLAYTLTKLNNKNDIEINFIEKYYGYSRDVIDNDIESLPYYHKLVFELYSLDINYQIIDYEDLYDLYKNNSKIKFILDEFITNTSFTIENFVDFFNNSLRIEPEQEIDKYKSLIEDDLPIHACGGGTMECFFEEITSLESVKNYLENKKSNIILETDLIFGETDYLEYEWMQDLNSKQIITSEFKYFQEKLISLNKHNKKQKKITKNKQFF